MKKKMLLRLWAENFDPLESREARIAWDDIVKKVNNKFGTKSTTDKYQKKMKYLVDRYKQAKGWNTNQSGGNQMKLMKFWVAATSLPFKMSKKRGVCRKKEIQTKQVLMQASAVGEKSWPFLSSASFSQFSV